MISWVVTSHRPDILEANLLATLAVDDGDELVLIEGAKSITLAYAEGQAKATQPIRCYIHHDVQILDLPRLRHELIESSEGVGVVGVVGSRDLCMPWWNGDTLGSVVDTRMGLLDFGPGGQCAVVDGLLLATRQTVQWDTEAAGWHGYDHDACAQMLARGLPNWCLTGAGEYVVHNAEPAKDRATGWDEAAARFRERWLR